MRNLVQIEVALLTIQCHSCNYFWLYYYSCYYLQLLCN